MKRRDTETGTENALWWWALRLEWCVYKLRNGKNGWQWQKWSRSHEADFPLEPSERAWLTNTLISHFYGLHNCEAIHVVLNHTISCNLLWQPRKFIKNLNCFLMYHPPHLSCIGNSINGLSVQYIPGPRLRLGVMSYLI